VGLAAVQLALQAGAVVFATAGSPEKRELLAALGVPHVMDSRTLAFADQVLELTEGKGVDLVLNSLAGEAIDKSLSILRPLGRFIEIGKTDIYRNRKIGMRALRNNISLCIVDLDKAFEERRDLAPSLLREVLRRFETNDLRPLPHRVFPAARIADAFRWMAQAKHIGKLVVSMQDTEGLQLERKPRSVAIDAGGSYLITGGLGGLGLAVAERLARHGARRLVLVGRSGPSPSAQAAVESLRQRGVHVRIFQADIADPQRAQEVIAAVRRELSPLRGILHAAMVLDDAPIERLTEERMWRAMAPKMLGAWNLHSLTADCVLDFFVMFSSMASISGSPGQANYAAANAFLDALAHHRRAVGLPALTVNWGVIGDTGHVAHAPEIGRRLERIGFTAIPVADMLDTLDELMSSASVQIAVAQFDWNCFLQSTHTRIPPRFAAMVGKVAGGEDRPTASSRLREMLDADEGVLPSLVESYLRDHLARAMGASSTQIDPQQPLLNLGLDSLIAVEVRNRISADLGTNVPLAKFRQVSVSGLATYVADQLLADDRRKRPDSACCRMPIETGPSIRATGDDPADLLARIDDLSDEEVDRHLSVLTAQVNE
jgi:NADPH:quinone reductase-like Zn-dependent oxidoreductase/aryl carrier-like protein